MLKIAALAFVLLYLAPIAIPAALYASQTRGDWRAADRLSTSLLLPAATHPRAIVRIFSARTVSWPGIIATHSWIVVKDAGPGIPLSERERVFEAFHTGSGGTGLGLAVVRTLARANDWNIEVGDAPEGSRCRQPAS